MSKDYKIKEKFSSKEFEQTDFGKIYYNTPSQTFTPRTIKELVDILADLNKSNTRVTVRNTGHSMNGQTLTSGVQVNIGKLRGIEFDKSRLLVKAGAGNTWDEVFKEIGLPEYSLPVFTNNPGQKIHVGGTASVGGAGLYGTKYGGVWNQIEGITFVTMTGEIIECTKTKNFNLMKYLLGGFGRVGVIVDVTMKVIESKPLVLAAGLVYSDFTSYFRDFKKALNLENYESIAGTALFSADFLYKEFHILPHMLSLMKEVSSKEEASEELEKINEIFGQQLEIFFSEKEGKPYDLSLSFQNKLIKKEDVVYYYPESEFENQLELLHPWSDYILECDCIPVLYERAVELLYKYDLINYLPKETIGKRFMDLPYLPIYTGKKTSKEFYPLVLDREDIPDYLFGISVFPNVPVEKLNEAENMVDELTDLVYELGGKRYLYAVHNLTKEQIIEHYGLHVIKEWNALKDKYDPKHLLNIGVIEHLDNF